MRSIKRIKNDIKELDEIKALVEVYEEIAASRMQAIRNDIFSARDFYERLAQLSAEVGADLESAGLGKAGEVAVFISSQTGLYGDIIEKIFMKYTNFVTQNPSVDKVVFGKLGDSMMKSNPSNLSYQYYDLDNEVLEGENLTNILNKLINYKKIHLFYGKFINIVSQEGENKTISGQTLAGYTKESLKDAKFYYIYEPSVDKISKLLTEQIAGAVFNQSMKESVLAKYGSRLIYLDDTLQKCDEKMFNLALEKNKTKKRIIERKQSISLASMI